MLFLLALAKMGQVVPPFKLTIGKPAGTSPSPHLGFMAVRHPPGILSHRKSGVQLIMTFTSADLGVSQFIAK